MNKKSDHFMTSESLLWLAATACSFSFQVPSLQAHDFILRVDTEGWIGEVPEFLSVGDYTIGDITFPSFKDHPREETATEPVEIRYENFGHGTRRLMAIADVLVPALAADAQSIASPQDSFSVAQRHVICSMRRAQIERSEGLMQWLATLLSQRLGRPAPLMEDALENEHFCDAPLQPASVQTPLVRVRLKKDGIMISSNPVWNACIGGGPITKALVAGNRDVFHHRRGHLHKDIPYSCRDYHRGHGAVWRHPDFPGLEVTLDDRGRLLGGLPAGYIAVRETQAVAEK